MKADHKRIFQDVDLTLRSNEAALSVGDSFAAALECLPVVLQGVEQPNASQAILLCGFALLHQREMHHEDRLNVSQDIVESLDCMAMTSESADCTKPTERESAIMFEALKNDFIRRMETVPTEAEHTAAMQRIRLLSQGRVHE